MVNEVATSAPFFPSTVGKEFLYAVEHGGADTVRIRRRRKDTFEELETITAPFNSSDRDVVPAPGNLLGIPGADPAGTSSAIAYAANTGTANLPKYRRIRPGKWVGDIISTTALSAPEYLYQATTLYTMMGKIMALKNVGTDSRPSYFLFQSEDDSSLKMNLCRTFGGPNNVLMYGNEIYYMTSGSNL